MTWVRDITQDSANIDREGTGSITVGYLWGSDSFVEPAQICDTPQNFLGGDTGVEPLPMRGSPHPTKPTFKLDTYTSDCEGRTQRIQALYSNDGRFVFPNDGENDRILNPHYSSAPFEVQVYYPFSERVLVGEAVPAGFSGPTVITPKLTRYPSTYYINTSMRQWTWEVLIKESERVQAETAMDNQNDRIHQIGGRYYRFKTGPLDFWGTVGEDRKYLARYTWIYDAGTRDSVGSPMLRDVRSAALPPNVYWRYFPKPTAGIGQTLPGPVMTRKPFHTVFHIEDVIGTSGEPVPVFDQSMNYTLDPTGWQTLVGL